MSGQGAMIGAAVGATYNAARGKDPLKGAMYGAAIGGTGGAMGIPGLSAAGAGTAAAGTTAATTAAGTGLGAAGTAAGTGTTIAGAGSALTGAEAATAANTAFMNPAGVNAAMGAGQTAGYTPAAISNTIFSGGLPVTTPAMQGQGLAQTTAIQRPLSLGMTGVEPGQGYEYTLGDRLDQVGQFAQRNPQLTQMAFQTGQSLLQDQQPQLQSPGLMRGTQMQVAAPQYQLGAPRISLI